MRLYLKETRISVRTEHNKLNRILSLTDSTGRLARWLLRLSKFEFDVIHRAGVKPQTADALSRLPTAEEDRTVLDDDLPVPAIEASNSNSFDTVKRDASRDVYILNEATYNPSYNAPPSENKFIAEHAIDSCCRAASLYIATLLSEFRIDSHGIHIRR